VTADDDGCCAVGVEASHGSESGFESAVVAFDAVVIGYEIGGALVWGPHRV
jgi:hypothetical protein